MSVGMNPMLRRAAISVVILLVVFALGGPAEAGALAGLRGGGAGAALGLVWIVSFPAGVLVVPALLVTGLAEVLHTRWVRARSPEVRLGLGSRSSPGDT